MKQTKKVTAKRKNIEIIKFNKNKEKDKLDLIIVLDVFRATTTMYYLFDKNIKKIFPTNNCEEAEKLAKKIKKCKLVGEKNGIKPKRFDYGNSPNEIIQATFNNENIVMSTSSGTKAILKYKCKNVIIGSLLNINAIIKYINKNNFHHIGICVTNNKDKKKYNEDYICAKYISSKIMSKKYNIVKVIKKLEEKKGNRFFKKELQDIFPKEDFYLSTKINIFDFVLKYNGKFIEKI